MPFPTHHIALLLTVVMMAGCSGFMPSSSSPPSSQPVQEPAPTSRQASNWAIGFTRLRVIDPQEDRQFASFSLSNGDEPYIILIAVKGELGRSGSTEIAVNRYQNDEWAENTKRGGIVDIPATMGIFEFRGVGNDTVIAILALAMESDRTPWPIIEDRLNVVRTNLAPIISREIEGRSSPDLRSTAFLDNLHQAMVEAVEPFLSPISATETLEDFIFSGIDTDELIGMNSMVFMTRPPSEALVFPYYTPPYFTDVLSNKDYLLNSFPLIFENSSLKAEYAVEVKVRAF